MKPTAKIRLAMLVFCITCVDFVDSLDEGY